MGDGAHPGKAMEKDGSNANGVVASRRVTAGAKVGSEPRMGFGWGCAPPGVASRGSATPGNGLEFRWDSQATEIG